MIYRFPDGLFGDCADGDLEDRPNVALWSIVTEDGFYRRFLIEDDNFELGVIAKMSLGREGTERPGWDRDEVLFEAEEAGTVVGITRCDSYDCCLDSAVANPHRYGETKDFLGALEDIAGPLTS